MATLYLDEDVPILLADLLRARGHVASTTRAEQRLGSPDPDQLLFAANVRFVLVTHNRGDFARLHEAWLVWTRGWEVQPSHAGIIVLGRVLGKPLEEYADLINDLLANPQITLTDAFYRWHVQAGWTQNPHR